MEIAAGSGLLLSNSFGDRYFYDVNGSAFDKLGSETLFEQRFGSALFKKNNLYVIAGTDSGLLPKYLVERGLPEGSYYLFIEVPSVLKRLKGIIPEGGFHKKVIVTTAEEWLSEANKIEYQNFVYLGNVDFISSFAATDGRLSDYFQLTVNLQEELEKARWVLNADLGTELFHVRQLENLPDNRAPVTCLKNLFAEKTAIVLGGGPSLDEVLPWVVRNRSRLVVIAVSRIARRLLDQELSPDLIVSVDPSQLSFDISKEMLELWKDTIFVNNFHVVNTLLGQWSGRSVFYGQRVPWGSPLNEDTIDALGPTVTNCAIDLAVKMGVSQLLLAGVDLCHSRDGYTHAQGSNERKLGPQLGKGLLWVETNGGWMAETTPDFHFAATQIERQASAAKQQGCRVISLTEGATKIADVEYLSTDAVKMSEFSEPALQTLLRGLPSDTESDRIEYYQLVLKELIRAQNAFRDIKALAISGLKANDSFFGKKESSSGNPKYKEKMDRIEKKLKNSFKDFNFLLKKFGIKDFLKMTQGDRDREWSEAEVETLGRYYYQAYRDSADKLFKLVSESIARIQNRLEEEKGQPDLKRLLESWKLDKLPGRSLVWKRNHPESIIPEECAEGFQELETEFAEILQTQETAHMQRARAWSDLGQVRGKLLLKFKQQQSESLTSLVENLAVQKSVQAQSLYHLGLGYLAELNNDQDSALVEYQQVFDLQDDEQDMSILEDTLLRLLNLFSQGEDYDNAKVAAECLAGMSANYLPYYADLLWLLGEKRTALDAYAEYYKQVPDDTVAMMKVGRYYRELGLAEGAAMMFEAVLELEPGNKVAMQSLEEIEESFEE